MAALQQLQQPRHISCHIQLRLNGGLGRCPLRQQGWQAEFVESVTLVHRRDDFRAAPDTVAKMRALVEDGRVTLHIGQLKGNPEIAHYVGDMLSMVGSTLKGK